MTESKNNDSQGFDLNKDNDNQKSSNSESSTVRKKINKKKATKNKVKKEALANKSLDLDEYSLGGIKYKLPGKRQRIIVASIVLGLNLALIIAVLLYLNNSAFHDFIYSVGRDI